ncbi:sulfite exporter TauE/SafE family protein [Sphingomonas sp. BGYR3]|uniref:sulfite exporter TauE/SafE family protein n=1 Tax=Sphingomonas sp. BGYR3 TaxID=2975483 RepID=UPI0021A3E41F|nr:sulfite exporter TauE/SafE family protein [Sphingomonas sp. BGYR3]MDG5488321.1 sulfite exporter TauE/SafE family protein [Sphingomonas sp. BGYR3]
MIQDPWFWAIAIPAVVLLGLSKGGFAGAGSLSLPMMATVIDPVLAAAILLPILIVQDAVGVWAFRRNVDWRVIGWALPGAIIGIGAGWAFSARVSADAVLAMVGGISILFGGWRLWLNRRGTVPARRTPGWVGTMLGIASGFTSHVAHAGAPPFQLWVMPMKLPRDILVGTTAIFFALVNLLKLPGYWALGQFDGSALPVAAILIPIAVASTLAGVWLVRRVPHEPFEKLIYVLMIAVGIKLVWDGLG